MGTPSLNLLGGIELTGVPARSANRLLSQAKVVGFLACLSLAPRGRFQRRDRLVGLLWPELDQAHARAALRKAVHATRQALGPKALAARGVEELLIDEAHLGCDVRTFVDDADAGRLTSALERYRGELMPGFHLPGCVDFSSWLDGQRQAIMHRAAAAAWALATQAEASKDLTKAGQLARQVVEFEWSDERILRRTMQMLHRIGDRAGAIRLYEDAARRIRTELGVDVADETTALADQLRQRLR